MTVWSKDNSEIKSLVKNNKEIISIIKNSDNSVLYEKADTGFFDELTTKNTKDWTYTYRNTDNLDINSNGTQPATGMNSLTLNHSYSSDIIVEFDLTELNSAVMDSIFIGIYNSNYGLGSVYYIGASTNWGSTTQHLKYGIASTNGSSLGWTEQTKFYHNNDILLGHYVCYVNGNSVTSYINNELIGTVTNITGLDENINISFINDYGLTPRIKNFRITQQ